MLQESPFTIVDALAVFGLLESAPDGWGGYPRMADLRQSTAARARSNRNHSPLLQREGTPAPLDAIHSKTCQPYEKGQQIAHRQQPDPSPQHRIAQAPHADRPGHRKSQNKICPEIRRADGRARRNAHRRNGPRQSVREEHPEMSAGANIADTDGPAQF